MWRLGKHPHEPRKAKHNKAFKKLTLEIYHQTYHQLGNKA